MFGEIILQSNLKRVSIQSQPTSQQYFFLTPNQYQPASQQYFSLTTNQHHTPAIASRIESPWIHAHDDLERKIACARLSRNLSMDRFSDSGVDVSLVFWNEDFMYILPIQWAHNQDSDHIWENISRALFSRMKLWRHMVVAHNHLLLNQWKSRHHDKYSPLHFQQRKPCT